MVDREGLVLFDCTDKLASQKELKAWASKNSVEYTRIGLKTNHMTVQGNTGMIWTTPKGEEEERCGVTIPAYAPPCYIAAANGVLRAVANDKLERSEDVTETKR